MTKTKRHLFFVGLQDYLNVDREVEEFLCQNHVSNLEQLLNNVSYQYKVYNGCDYGVNLSASVETLMFAGVDEMSSAYIQAHGNKGNLGHVIWLSKDKSGQLTSEAFSLLSKIGIYHVELFSCFSGAALSDVEKMRVGFSATAHSSSNSTVLIQLMNEELRKSIMGSYKNPFIEYIKTIACSATQANGIAIKTGHGAKIFVTELPSIVSDKAAIMLWQKTQIEALNSFYQEVLLYDLPSKVKMQIKSATKFIGYGSSLIGSIQTKCIDKVLEWLLVHASHSNDYNRVNALLNFTSPNVKISDGLTPLVIASKNGNYPIVKLLQDAGADINHETETGTDAIEVAEQHGHQEIAEYLSRSLSASTVEVIPNKAIFKNKIRELEKAVQNLQNKYNDLSASYADSVKEASELVDANMELESRIKIADSKNLAMSQTVNQYEAKREKPCDCEAQCSWYKTQLADCKDMFEDYRSIAGYTKAKDDEKSLVPA